MPEIVNFGDYYGNIEFPDGTTDDQIVQAYDRLEAERATSAKTAKLRTEQLTERATRPGLTIPQSIAVGAESGLYSVPVALGEIINAGADLLPKQDSPATAPGGVPVPSLTKDFVGQLGMALSDWGAKGQERNRGLAEDSGESPAASTARSLAETGVTSAVTLPAAIVSLPAAAVAAGAQQYGLTKRQFRDQLIERNPNMPLDEADRVAGLPAVLSGIATALLTRVFGGTEKFIERIVAGNLKIGGVKQLLSEAARSSYMEFPEELLDQAAQGYLEKAYVNPDKTQSEIWQEAVLAGGAGAVLGFGTPAAIGGIGLGAENIANRIEEPKRLRTGAANRRAAISGMVERGEIPSFRTGEPQNAEAARITPPQAGQETSPGQEALGGVRLRNDAQSNGVEAQAGEAVNAPPETQPQGTPTPAPTGQPVVSQISSAIQDVTSRWINPPPIRIAQTASELPADIQQAAVQQGHDPARIRGVAAPDGTVWLVALNIRDQAHAREILLEETVGHMGAEAVLSPENFRQFAEGVAARHSDTELGRQVRAVYGNDPFTVGREIIGKLAQNPQEDPNLWQRIVATIRQWARTVMKVEISDNDVRSLLMRARQKAEQGKLGGPSINFAAQQRIPIQIQRADGTVVEGEFNGYYDLTALGKGAIPSIGWRLEDGSMTHGMLRPGEQIVTKIPTFDEWKQKPKFSLYQQPSIFNNEKTIELGLLYDLSSNRYSGDLINRGAERGTGQATGLYLTALEQAQAKGAGWQSDSILSDNARRIYERLIKAGLPFRIEDGQYVIDANELSGVPLDYIRSNVLKNAGVAFSIAEPEGTPAFFKKRSQLLAAQSNPGLSPEQIQQAEDLAKVQASMAPDSMVGWLMQTPKDEIERRAQNALKYIQDRRYLSLGASTQLSSLPSGTEAQRRARLVAGATILAHYGIDLGVLRTAEQQIEKDQAAAPDVLKKIGKLNSAQVQANFLTAMFTDLAKGYRTYLEKRAENAPASQNLKAEYQAQLANAERRMQEHEVSPVAIQRALSAIAKTIPPGLLMNASNQAVVDWVVNNGALVTVVSDAVREWMTVDDGTGSPAMLHSPRLVQDLGILRDIINNSEQVEADLKAFEQWFQPSGKGKKVNPTQYAQAYFKFRTGRDRAARIAAALEKEIGDIDTRLRTNIMVQDRLGAMMKEPDYRDTVRQASQDADIAVRSIGESSQVKTGLIERDKTVGRWRIVGPETGTEYVVDLYPSSVQEKENRAQLASVVLEARNFASNNSDEQPLLADEWTRLADYIEQYLLDPSFDPAQGFTMEGKYRIPGTTARVATDPFEYFSYLTGPLFKTIRDVIERIGGRPMRQIWLDADTLDKTMRKVEVANKDPKFGFEAQSAAAIKAIESHGWRPEMFSIWNSEVAERILAAAQNNLGPGYNIGDTIVGTGHKVTAADIGAIRIMKLWEDAVMKAAPPHIRDRIDNLWITRAPMGSGRFTASRIAANWTRGLMKDWLDARTDADKLTLLQRPDYFGPVVMGYIGEFNPEFSKMNPASAQKSPLFKIYRQAALTERQGVQRFNDLDSLLDFIAAEMVSAGLSADQITAKQTAKATLLSEIGKFIDAFDRNVLRFKSEEAFGDVPPEVISAATANNSFTTPRGPLQAPSTFYTYSKFSDAARLGYASSLRSLLNLKILQSYREAIAAMEKTEADMEKRIAELQKSGMWRIKAKKQVANETEIERKAGQIRYDYLNLTSALKLMRQAFGSLEQFESATTDRYEHPGLQAFQNVTGTIKSTLLSSPQAVVNNFQSATLLGPALFHWQTGQYLKALVDILPMPAGALVNLARRGGAAMSGRPYMPYQTGLLSELLMKKISSIWANDPTMSKLLKLHAPLWDSIAQNVIEASKDWRRISHLANQAGIVTPYNLRRMWKNQSKLKRSGGRMIEADDMNKMGGLTTLINSMMSAPGLRHLIEGTKATFPRVFDNIANYALIMSWEHEQNALKTLGFIAFKNREAQAAKTGADWMNVNEAQNTLTPQEIGLDSYKSLSRMRDLFVGLGGLDRILLDYYERTKGLTPEQREQEPLIPNEDDRNTVAMQYAAISNLATESNRPHWTRGKGSTGFIKSVIGTFMGWAANMMKQFGKATQTHSKDPKYWRTVTNMATIGTMVVLLAAVGAWNWEVGDELTKMVFNVHSARLQAGNIHEAQTALAFFAQSLVNTVPIFGSMIGSMAGVAFTGRGNPFDLSSQMFQLNLMSDVYRTFMRIKQTGDMTLPMADFMRRWMGVLPKAILNRVPILRGMVDQSNAVRALNASAPPGTEIKWGRGGGGEVVYGPANDEIQKLIGSAYEAILHGGSVNEVRARYMDAVNALIREGKSPQDAAKQIATGLAAKEPIRILTGKEFTPQQEAEWLKRMTPDQRKDYDSARQAWALLGAVTGKDLNMTTTAGAPTGRMQTPVGMGGASADPMSLGAMAGGGGSRRSGRLRTPKATPLSSVRVTGSSSIRPARVRRTRGKRSRGARLRTLKSPSLGGGRSRRARVRRLR